MIDPTLEATFTLACTGDVCSGDAILFTEAVFGGSYRTPKFIGERRIAARIVNDSYGAHKQQHTFSLVVIASDGVEPLVAGTATRRKGRNVYRNGVMRQPWADEEARRAALHDKHARGDAARAARQARKDEQEAF